MPTGPWEEEGDVQRRPRVDASEVQVREVARREQGGRARKG